MKLLWSCPALVLLGLAPPAGADTPPKAKTEAKAIRVPFRLTAVKHILVRAKINGKGPFNFILDTGAPALFVIPKVCKKVGITPDRKGWGTFERFEIEGGAVVVKARGRIEAPFQLEGINGLGLAGVELHGIIGYNILARYRMEIDFTRDKMLWTPLDFKPKPPLGLGARRGGGQGGLEIIGTLMKSMGGLLGRKAEPDVRLRGFLGLDLKDGGDNPVVRSVLTKGPAGQAGLQAGDRITHFNGRSVQAPDDVHRFARKIAGGAAVKLTVLRDKETIEITFKAGEGL